MLRRDLSRTLFASALGSAVPAARSVVPDRNRPEYSQTAAELAAKVTIEDSSLPPGCVDRYKVNAAPGSTSMVAAFESAVRQAQQGGAQITYGLSSPYLLDSPVNCTFAGTVNQHAVVIRNIGDAGFNIPGLLARHRGVAVFDFTGTSAVELYDVVIGTDAVIYPQTGVLWARNSHGGSLFHKMQNCHILGKFSVAPFYNYGAENDVLIDCYLANFATTPNTQVAVWTAHNVAGLRSVVDGLIATGAQSCIEHNCFGNQFYNEGGSPTSDCVYLEDADSWKNFGGWAYSASPTSNGGALIHVDMSNGASNFGVVQGLTGEVSTHLQSYGIRFSDHPAVPTGWTISGCRLPSAIRALHAGVRSTLDTFHIANLSEQASHGLEAAGALQDSVLQTGAMPLRIGRSKNNSLTGYSANWTIGTRSSDTWADQGGSRSWEANTAALRAKGALQNRATYLVHGPFVTVNVVLAAAVSIVCDKGAAIGGLPFAAADFSANVKITNITSHTELGGGYIDGTRIHLPAIDVGSDTLVITATYTA
jgi:hypothetical protein